VVGFDAMVVVDSSSEVVVESSSEVVVESSSEVVELELVVDSEDKVEESRSTQSLSLGHTH
jgi:hypothetical protein